MNDTMAKLRQLKSAGYHLRYAMCCYDSMIIDAIKEPEVKTLIIPQTDKREKEVLKMCELGRGALNRIGF